MAVTHSLGYAGYFDLNGSAKAGTFMFIGHVHLSYST